MQEPLVHRVAPPVGGKLLHPPPNFLPLPGPPPPQTPRSLNSPVIPTSGEELGSNNNLRSIFEAFKETIKQLKVRQQEAFNQFLGRQQ